MSAGLYVTLCEVTLSFCVSGCGSLMKKCVQCRAPIDKMIPFIVCCGGTGKHHVLYIARLERQ